MELLHRIKNWFTALFRHGRKNSDLEEEIEAHIAMRTEMNIEAGMPPEIARKQAMKGFGNAEYLKEECRDSWGVRMICDLLRDVRMGWRQALKSWRYSFIIILTLGLCIGANTAIFSMLNNYLFKHYPDYPFPDRDRLVRVCSGTQSRDKLMMPDRIPLAAFNDLQRSESLAEIGICQNGIEDVMLDGRVHAEPSVRVSPSFFRALGVQPWIGRWFDEEEKVEGRHRVVILSHPYWESEFDSDPEVLGGALKINEESFEVVGVMPKGFYFQNRDTSLWRPLIFDKNRTSSRVAAMTTLLISVARLNPYLNREQSEAELKSIISNSAELGMSNAQQYPMAVGDIRLEDYFYDGDKRPKQGILLLQGSALLILLIGCINIANLLLARLKVRSREVALRAMLGAGTGRIARMLLTESFIYATVGCLAGLILGYVSIEIIKYFEFYIVYNRGPMRLDRTVLAYTLLMSLGCSFVMGGLPVLASMRLRLSSGNHDGGRSASTGSEEQRLRGLLIVGQVAMTCILLITTGMFIKSLNNLLKVDPGFDPNQTLVIKQIRASSQLKNKQRNQYFAGLLEHLQKTPGIMAVGANGTHPFSGIAIVHSFYLEGQTERIVDHSVNEVKGGYFKAVGLKVIDGRVFDKFDFAAEAERVAIVDQSFASKHFPNESAVGKRLKHNPRQGKPNWTTIVGVVENVKQHSLAEQQEKHTDQIYIPSSHWPVFQGSMIVRYGEGEQVTDSVFKSLIIERLESAIYDYNPMAPPPQILGYEEIISDSLKERRILLGMLIAFASLALILSSIGLYGVIAYTVQQRLKEIGIRLAIGAPLNSITQLMVRGGMKLTLVGLLTGLVGAGVANHLIRSQLFEVATLDKAVYVLVGGLIVTISFLASYVPSRRALSVDPIATLRGDQ